MLLAQYLSVNLYGFICSVVGFLHLAIKSSPKNQGAPLKRYFPLVLRNFSFRGINILISFKVFPNEFLFSTQILRKNFLDNYMTFLIFLVLSFSAIPQIFYFSFVHSRFRGPTSGIAVTLKTGRREVPGSNTGRALSTQPFGVFRGFLLNLRKYRLGSLRKTLTDGIP